MPTTPEAITQAAAIPLRGGRVCLVTSRSGKRWVIPKGNFEDGMTAGEIALKEAWEEAGLSGSLQQEPVGSYVYEKAGQRYHVTVFLMQVNHVADLWPERGLRVRSWLTIGQAAGRVEEHGLRELIRSVDTVWVG
jgi:8-oxo-dGTP pyrophosphatase MutT (NUDIX family)